MFANGRNVGRVPERITREIAPLLDALGGAAIVNGAGSMTGSIRLRVDLPTAAGLAGFVDARGLA